MLSMACFSKIQNSLVIIVHSASGADSGSAKAPPAPPANEGPDKWLFNTADVHRVNYVHISLFFPKWGEYFPQ